MRSRDQTLRAVAAAVIAVVVLTGILLARRRGQNADVPPEVDGGAVVGSGGAFPSCGAGLELVAGGACYAAAGGAAGRPLVVYLHGLHTSVTLRDELERQARVARIATAKGFDVLAPRGLEGACERVPEMFCWPSNERVAERGPAAVAGWGLALAAARGRGATGPRYLLGFSNGGYFASLVATRALAPFEAITVAHGGPVEPVRAEGAKPPMLLLMTDDDAALGEMMRLDASLSREKWPHASTARDGGHALTDQDVTNAVTFFGRVAKEGVPAMTARLTGHTPRAPAPETAESVASSRTTPSADPPPAATAPASAPDPAPDPAPAASDVAPPGE